MIFFYIFYYRLNDERVVLNVKLTVSCKGLNQIFRSYHIRLNIHRTSLSSLSYGLLCVKEIKDTSGMILILSTNQIQKF